MLLSEAKQILKNTGYLVENHHFDLWQYKLTVKKMLKGNLFGENKGYRTFEELRAGIQWELFIDIVDTMKQFFEEDKTPEECIAKIRDMAKEAMERS